MTDNVNSLEFLMDKILQNCPDFEPFTVSGIIDRTTFDNNVNEILASNSNQEITILLTDHFKYADETSTNSLLIRLSPLGVKVKNSGGHFAYLKPLADKVVADTERQNKSDKILDIDVKQKPFTYNTRLFGIVIPILALIGAVISIFIALKSLSKKEDQQDLQEVKKDLLQLQKDVQRQDSLFRVDTALLKKHILHNQ